MNENLYNYGLLEVKGAIVLGFIDKMGDFFFPRTEEEVAAEGGNTAAAAENKQNKKAHLISVPAKDQKADGAMEMVLIKATSYDDMQDIARHIKERKVAVVNFEDMDKDVAQRMVDFLSGATFALNGVPRKVSGGTFIFSSSDVDMFGQIMDKDAQATEATAAADPFGRDPRFSTDQWLRK